MITQKLFTNPDLTHEELEAAVDANVNAKNFGEGFISCYEFSKAALSALTLVHSKAYPNLTITSLNPGFVQTAMSAGYGAKLTPEEGCVSSIKCLFGSVVSGCYYDSNGFRSSLI